MGVNGRSIGFMLRSDTLQITPEILSLIARIDEFKGAWRALGTLAPDRLSALQRNVHLYIALRSGVTLEDAISNRLNCEATWNKAPWFSGK
jgi:hypothetical protein